MTTTFTGTVLQVSPSVGKCPQLRYQYRPKKGRLPSNVLISHLSGIFRCFPGHCEHPRQGLWMLEAFVEHFGTILGIHELSIS